MLCQERVESARPSYSYAVPVLTGDISQSQPWKTSPEPLSAPAGSLKTYHGASEAYTAWERGTTITKMRTGRTRHGSNDIKIAHSYTERYTTTPAMKTCVWERYTDRRKKITVDDKLIHNLAKFAAKKQSIYIYDQSSHLGRRTSRIIDSDYICNAAFLLVYQ